MYGEAYMELLRLELAKDEFDPKLEKLKKDLLDPTEKRLEKQARINPDDPAIFTILADVNFHKGKLDQASAHVTQALQNRSGPIANYVFAKILFKKGNISQAFDQMGNVLESMPDSPVVFADFQFLYSCKSYGLPTARKIVKNTNFIKRATPVAGDDNLVEAPESPFENDPTQPPDVIAPPTDGIDIADVPEDIATAEITESEGEEEPIDDSPLPDEIEMPDLSDLPDDVGDIDIERPVPISPTTVEQPTEPVSDPDADPEQENIKKAEYWLDQANKQFNNRNYDDAKNNLEKAVSLYATVPGKDELKKKLDAKFDLFRRYKAARDLFEQEKYEQALPTIEEAYREEPDRFKEAPFYIGKIYLLRPEPDRLEALKNFNIILQDKNLDPLFKRDIEWTKLEILYELERYEEAKKLFEYFDTNEKDYAKNQQHYYELKYGIWYQLNYFGVNIGIGIFVFMFLVVFALQLLPAITLAFMKPENIAKRAFEKKKYQKAVNMVEKALARKQPVQIEREMLEIAVKSHFELKNFVRCQDYAKELLEKFAGNHIAWGYLAKASIACNDTSSQAIAMYESIYKDNPEKTEYLPILARHYAKTRNYTVEAMGILFTYYQTDAEDPEIVIALAEGYVQNRSMGNEVITVLEEAIKEEDRTEFRELLARNYAKSGRYSDAARECLVVLDDNLNNMGIHVVYSSSMKKLNMLDEAIKQYEMFLQRSPENAQLNEILSGLKKDAETFDGSESLESDLPELHSFSDELPDLPQPDLPEPDLPPPGISPEDVDIEGFVEPPPEGFELDNENIPLPDFLKEDTQKEPEKPVDTSVADLAIDPEEMPELDPFADPDSLLDEFAAELPEELGGPGKIEEEATFSPPPPPEIDAFAADTDDFSESEIPEPQPVNSSAEESSGYFEQLTKARELSSRQKWAEVIEILNPIYASERNKDVGMLLANALIEKKEPLMAMEIVDTLDIDPELMGEDIKDILYRTGVALESAKNFDEALKMYDMICNADINYKDAFDRSDKIYAKKKA
ncbi:MAG: hypothetical protein PWR01_3356 [Clostridiales bacterium]|nr:hypothetical protein [Clostridiales bacterium]MDN5282283.1 hypothetical protein [Candidatus Ozemobacter sp.]